MKRATKRAIKKYGADNCRLAYKQHSAGNGANTIAFELGLGSTRSGDAAINAGRELDFLDYQDVQRGNHSLVTGPRIDYDEEYGESADDRRAEGVR
jgi:hypothetical protein